MSEQNVNILEGNTFVVSDRRGDIEASPSAAEGLFRDDTRFLSRWVLTVDGKRADVLSVENLRSDEVQHFLVPGAGTVYINSVVSLIRKRKVADGFHEWLTIFNHSDEERALTVRIEADSDFADLFEVKDALKKKGTCYRAVDGGRLVLGYRRERFNRETAISSDPPADFDDRGLVFRAVVPPQGSWTCRLAVEALRSTRGGSQGPRPSLDRWSQEAPRLVSSWRSLERTYERCLEDLAALRFYPLLVKGALPAAGLPWFMTVFGRDSLITSLQALPFTPDLARTTLLQLAEWQGSTIDDFRDEEPGKILHELRMGEMVAFEERPHSPYFGSADSTPLFLILLDEYERWSGDEAVVRQLEFAARAGLEWIDKYGDRDGDGYVEYERRNAETGLENQCWKDSWDSIKFADGRLAKLPRACCEIQGYVYDAKMRCARLARRFWNDRALADRLEAEAARLKKKFNEDFWIERGGYYALALDGDKKQVDSLTSNIGHLLWSGIADTDKAASCVRHLMGKRLNSGWGIRTMAEGDAAYNPIGYHVGTVWPHDNSMIALGLRRYGYRREAARVAHAMLEAAHFFQGRLPEAFAGYPRSLTNFPVEYPTACSPQAWSTGAPFLLLRTLLGLEPVEGRLLVDPALPESIERIELTEIPGRWGRADAFGLGRLRLEAA
ncbi:MAG TPA: glycogen debranching N-terminal domain-containing protein [Planctomycetota bacterium]